MYAFPIFQVLIISAMAFGVAKKGEEYHSAEIEQISDGYRSLVNTVHHRGNNLIVISRSRGLNFGVWTFIED